MIKISQLISAANAAGLESAVKRTHAILIYGMPKVGKTELTATVAKIPSVKRIFWFDLENGWDTIADMYRRGRLTTEEIDKFILIKVPDTKDTPTGIDTLLKAIASKTPAKICDAHGTVACAVCKDPNSQLIFDHKTLTHEDVIVIDSLSQAGVSALNKAMKGMSDTAKPGWDEYGLQVRWLSDLCITIQACPYASIIAITHVAVLEDEEGKDTYSPLCGTKTFSAGLAKHFGTVVYVQMKMKKHKAGSSTTYNSMSQAGSRIGIELEKQEELDLSDALIKAGLFTSKASALPPPAEPTTLVEEKKEEVKVEDAPPTTVVKRFGPK